MDPIAAFTVIFFFVAALVGYIDHGMRARTPTTRCDPGPGTAGGFIGRSIVGEIAGFSVLLAGFVEAQIL